MSTREIDPRRRQSRFIQNVVLLLRRGSLADGLNVVLDAIDTPRTFRSYDSLHGVLVAANLSNLPVHRAKAERILGGPVEAVVANSHGTIWKKAV